MPRLRVLVRPFENFQVTFGNDFDARVNLVERCVVLFVRLEARCQHGTFHPPLARFPADQVIRVNSRTPYCGAECSQSNRLEQRGLAVAVVGQQQIQIGHLRLRYLDGVEVLVRMTKGNSALPEGPEVFDFNVVDIHDVAPFKYSRLLPWILSQPVTESRHC